MKHTMSYCTQNGINPGDIAPNRISVDQLKQLTSEDDVVVQSVIDGSISDADNEIDGYCERYEIPFSPVPSRVKTLSIDISVYNLFKKRSANIGMPDAIRQTYEDAIEFLKLITSGKANIPGVAEKVTSTAASSSGGSFSASEKIFTDETMKNL